VGDAAGQTKPTTAGGIYTCGVGGLLAGRAVAKAITGGDDGDCDVTLGYYQKEWSAMFGEEFSKMLLARRLLERLDNRALDDLFSAIPKDKLEDVSSTGDFDFHAAALGKMLNVKSASKMAKALLGNEIRRLVEG
ncbi:MAG TPA: dehydrogenase, partial [Nitrososphaera sp.]|nr:dehydrogenase [Nitrososphaera sp.]